LTTCLKLGVTIAMALAGAGASAIVVGSNVVTPIPLTIDLFLVRRWRPRPGWWRSPDWRAYRPALRFGFQQSASALLAAARGAVEAAVLPMTVGYTAIGLLNRARALLTSTVGRVANILAETAYPLLPRYAADARRFAAYATLFARTLMLVAVPGIAYVALEGRWLSRIVYGERWVAADPLIWPAAVAALGLTAFSVGLSVLLATSRLRVCLLLDAAAAAVSLPLVLVAWMGHGVVAYAWAAATGQFVTGVASLVAASHLFEPGWIRMALVPPMLGSVVAIGAVTIVDRIAPTASLGVRVGLDMIVYGLVLGTTIRGLFARDLRAVLDYVPGGRRLGGWLRLPGRPAISAVSQVRVVRSHE